MPKPETKLVAGIVRVLHIRGVIPSLNKIQTASVVKTKTGKRITRYGLAKKAWTEKIALLARQLDPVEKAYFTFLHVCRDRRTDPDNFCGVSQKVALDGLKKAKRIPNDGWEQVLGLAHYWRTGASPCLVVIMSDTALTEEVAWDVESKWVQASLPDPKRGRAA